MLKSLIFLTVVPAFLCSLSASAQKPAKLSNKALGREKVILKAKGKITQQETQGVVNTDDCDSSDHLWKKKDVTSGDLYHACYKGDKVDGRITYYYSNGKAKKTGFRRNEKNEGEWSRFFEDGTLKDRGDWKNDVPHDDWKFYHANGKLKSKGEFNAGKKVGDWVDYYENGNTKEKIEFDDAGKKHDDFAVYFANGQLKEEGEYEHGKKTGSWVTKNEKGEILAKGDYACDQKMGDWKEGGASKNYPADPCGTGGANRGRFLHFRGNALAVLQEGDGETFSGQLSWNPTLFRFFTHFDLRGNLGFSLLKDGSDGGLFLRMETGLMIGWHIAPKKGLHLETTFGAQRFFDREWSPYFGGNFVKKLNSRVLFLFSHFWAGFSHSFIEDAESNDFKVGLGAEF